MLLRKCSYRIPSHARLLPTIPRQARTQPWKLQCVWLIDYKLQNLIKYSHLNYLDILILFIHLNIQVKYFVVVFQFEWPKITVILTALYYE